MVSGESLSLSGSVKLLFLSLVWALVILKLAAFGAPGSVASYPLNHDLSYPSLYIPGH